jgi:hypothetical protein
LVIAPQLLPKTPWIASLFLQSGFQHALPMGTTLCPDHTVVSALQHLGFLGRTVTAPERTNLALESRTLCIKEWLVPTTITPSPATAL